MAVCWLQYKLHRVLSAKGDTTQLKKDVKSLAKNLLKKPENRNNLLIWEWYAWVEGKMEGSTEVTAKLLETVLRSREPTLPDDYEGLLVLARVVRYYVENSLGIGSLTRSALKEEEMMKFKNDALMLLLRYAEKQPVFSTTVSRDFDDSDNCKSKKYCSEILLLSNLNRILEFYFTNYILHWKIW